MSAKYARRVARGVALLDADVPDWRSKVDCDTLDLGNCEQCLDGRLIHMARQGVEEGTEL